MNDTDFERDLAGRLRALADRAPTQPSARPLVHPVVTTRRSRALEAVAALVVVAVAAAGVVWALTQRDADTTVTVGPEPTPAPTTSTDLPQPPPATLIGWSSLPPGPVDGRTFPVAVWTGAELIVWGGETESEVSWANDGAALDPATGGWRPLAPAPLSPRSEHVAVWTGTEMIVCCGRAPDGDHRRAAAYDPATDTWRRLADPPFDASFAVAVWTGSEMLVTGGADFTGTAAYDPATDTWRSLADPPAVIERRADAAWTGTHLVVWPRVFTGAPGLLYDPAADTWRALPELPDELHADRASMVWTGDEIVVWGSTSVNNVGGTVGARIRPGDDVWRPIVDAPLPAYDPRNDTFGASSAVWTGSEMLIWAGAIGTDHPDDTRSPTLAYNPTTDTWRRLDEAPIGAYHPPMVWTGTSAYVLAQSTLAFTPPDPTPASVSLAELPELVDASVLSVRPNNLSLAITDLRSRTVRQFPQASTTVGPGAASGATITPRGDIAVWVDATVHVFAEGDLDTEPHQLTPSRVVYPPGIATELFVQPSTDGDHLWIVQPAICCNLGESPTIVDRVDTDTGEITATVEIAQQGFPIGDTERGLIVNLSTDPLSASVLLVGPDGTTTDLGPGGAIATWRNLVVIGRTDSASLIVLDLATGTERAVAPPEGGSWRDVGGPVIPSTAQPFPTVSRDGRLLVSVPGPDLDGDENHEPDTNALYALDLATGDLALLADFARSSILATWSADGQRVVLFDRDDLQILDPRTGRLTTVAGAIPVDHFPMGAG